MKNIIYDHQVFAMQEYGGVSRYFYELCSRLERVTHQAMAARIVAPIHVNHYLPNLPARQLVSSVKMKRYPGSWRVLKPLNHYLTKNHFIKHQAKNKPDIVHETFYSLKTSTPKHCPSVITVYDMLYEKFPQYVGKYDNLLKARKMAIQRADRVICISESTKKELIQYLDIPESKISMIHLGFEMIDQEQSILNKNNARAHHKTRPYLLHVGYRAGYKNFDALLQAYASSTLLHSAFDLVTFGPNPLTTSERHLISQLGLGGKVRYATGDDGELIQYYKHASAFVYPSLHEGFGIPLLEAMQFGCPVVCSKTTSIPEVAGAAAHYFDPSSLSSIRQALEEIITSPSLRQEKISLGLARIKHFSWDTCASQTAAVYAQLLR
jgi:glycosyltransferase involved in cell wall biosynthesis